MDETTEALYALIRNECDVQVVPSPDADLFKKLHMVGDDVDAFMQTFSERFGVDMTGYLWYFHTSEEVHNFGALLIKPPDQRVTRIPVTINLLLEAIAGARWPVVYPPHSLPERRWDIFISPFVMMAVLGLIYVAVIVIGYGVKGLRGLF